MEVEGTETAPSSEVFVPQSTVLTEEEVQQTISDEPVQKEEVLLASEKEEQAELPDKFKGKTEAEIVAMYKELESKLGESKPEAPKEEPPAPTPKEANFLEETLDKYGEDIPADVLVDLEKKGISKPIIDTIIAGKKAETRNLVDGITKDFGGAEEFNKATAWAKEAWSEAEIASYDKALSQTDGKPELVKMVISNLMNSYNGGKPTAPNKPIHTNTAAPKATKGGFTSKADMYKDMEDPLYGKDHEYMSKFQDRMALTDQSTWYTR